MELTNEKVDSRWKKTSNFEADSPIDLSSSHKSSSAWRGSLQLFGILSSFIGTIGSLGVFF
jgi:hypothetical protein